MTGMWYHILDKCGMTVQIWRKPKIRKEVKNVKKVLSMVLAVVMLASTLSLCFVSTFTASAEEVKVVTKGQVWQWLVWTDVIFSDGTATIPEGALTGEDTGLEWGEGNAPFGETRTTNMGISLDYGNKFVFTDGATLEDSTPDYELDNMYEQESRGFIDSINNGTPNRSDIDRVLETAKLLEALYKSAELKKEITF